MQKSIIAACLLVVVILWFGLLWVLGDLREQRNENHRLHAALDTLHNDVRSLSSERDEAASIARKLLGISDN